MQRPFPSSKVVKMKKFGIIVGIVCIALVAIAVIYVKMARYNSYIVAYDGITFMGEKSRGDFNYNELTVWRGGWFPPDFNDARYIQTLENKNKDFYNFSITINGICYQFEKFQFSNVIKDFPAVQTENSEGSQVELKMPGKLRIVKLSSEGDVSDLTIASAPLSQGPAYLLEMRFWKDEAVSIYLRVNTMRFKTMQPHKSLIDFAYLGNRFELPTKASDIERIFGKPRRIGQYLTDW
jgi:hypothetical protein